MSRQDRYWDSSTFIAFFREEEGRVDLCRAIIDAAFNGDVRIVTSTLTFSEVVHIRHRERLTAEMEDELRAFFEYDFIVPVVLDRAVSEYARELMWRHPHLRPYDANHLSSAYHAGVNIIDSFDDDFLRLDGQFTGIDGSPIHIGHPSGWNLSLDL